MTSATATTAGGPRATAASVVVTEQMRFLTGSLRDASRWSGEERQHLLRWADRLSDEVAVFRAGLLVAEREAGAWRGGGDRSFESWRSRTSLAAPRVAAAQVREAERLATVPEVVAAVTGGDVSLAHAAMIARVAATGTAAQRDAVASPDGRARLLGWAREQDARTFETTVARWAAGVDPDGLESDHQAQRGERFLRVADTARGTFLTGRLDRMAGHRVRLALEAVTSRPGKDDDRDAGQRAADALDAMATQILSAATTKPGAHVPPHVSLIMTEETFVAARAHRDRRRAVARTVPRHQPGATAREGVDAAEVAASLQPTGSPTPAVFPSTATSPTPAASPASAAPAAGDGAAGSTGEVPAVVTGYPPATLEDGTPVAMSEVAVVMCDCAVTRIVVDACGVPLDLGRTQRLFTGEQRRAVLARDRECIWPTCHAPARWAQIHHIRWWEADDGPTSVDNGAAMCSFHHHVVHRDDLSITRILTPDDEGPPGVGGRRGRRRRSAIALVTYEFRDPTGRLVGEPHGPPDAHRPSGACEAQSARPPVGAGPPDHARVGADADADARAHAHTTSGGDGPRPPRVSGSDTLDELDLGWTTDPMTGSRVPAFRRSG